MSPRRRARRPWVASVRSAAASAVVRRSKQVLQFIAQMVPDAWLEIGVGQHQDVLAQFAGGAQQVDQTLFETVTETVGGLKHCGQHGWHGYGGSGGGGGTIPENRRTG